MNEQFLYHNQTEISKLITVFRDLQTVHNFGLFLDKDGWELIDLYFGQTILRRKFTQVKPMIEEIQHIKHSIVECGCIRYRRNKPVSSSQSWALKHLQKIYPEHYNYFVYGNI